ncbi:calcium-binding protein [Streptomyces sp. NPDC004788]
MLTAALACAAALPVSSAEAATGNAQITKVVVNGGKDIVVGTSPKAVTITATISEDTALKALYLDFEHVTRGNVDFQVSKPATCTGTGAVRNCSVTYTLDPRQDVVNNAVAGGGWRVYAQLESRDDLVSGYYPSVSVRRAAALTVDASPEPVRKGAPITVTGRLTVASWNTDRYAGWGDQALQLQFRKAGTSTYATVKTVRTSSTGDVRTTVTASADGFWRWRYAAPSNVQWVSATGDYVDVR